MDDLSAAIRGIVRDEFRVLREEAEVAARGNATPLTRSAIVDDPRRLYSVATAADLLGVSRSYVYDRISSREISVVELGDTRAKQRISAIELQRFIDARSF